MLARARLPSPLQGSVMSAGYAGLGMPCSDSPDSDSVELPGTVFSQVPIKLRVAPRGADNPTNLKVEKAIHVIR